jgi:hypothetical protein
MTRGAGPLYPRGEGAANAARTRGMRHESACRALGPSRPKDLGVDVGAGSGGGCFTPAALVRGNASDLHGAGYQQEGPAAIPKSRAGFPLM